MIKKYKAIFFDRDETLTYNDPSYEAFRNSKIEEWSGKPFELPYDKFIRIHNAVKDVGHSFAPYKNVDEELLFFREWYKLLLLEEGITDGISEKADMLTEKLWYIYKSLYLEVIEVLEYFKSREYKMGVISNCTPSLELTLQKAGIAKYFSSFTCSSLVCASKPSSIIFNTALNVQGVEAYESIFVDDIKEFADGAREQGFTSFYLDRQASEIKDKWTISNLKEIVDFVEIIK